MGGTYKVLRVPIVLIHQSVYDTSHRLEKLDPFVRPAERVETTLAIQPFVPVKKDDGNLFERIPYLRKFFSMVDFDEKVICRVCNKVADNELDRRKHFNCFTITSRVLDRLMKDGKCLYCEEQLNKVDCKKDYEGIPVCSLDCLEMWDIFTPEDFNAELAILKEELKVAGRWDIEE